MKKPIPFGKYLLLERVNVGGMAEVFKAKAFGVEGFERLVAVKRILPSIAEDREFITMFIDEAKIAVQLTHANIAQIFDLGKHADSYYIAMEFVPGKDARAIFDRTRKRGETIPVPMAAYVVMKVCEGLDYAHNKKDSAGQHLNLVHRDVSPQNVLVSYDGEIKLIDFGIAKAANKANKTQAGILKGKFGYMSPEQVRGLPLDRRSDVFAVGICLYELLTGERLFLGESDFSTLEKVRNVDIMPPRTYNRKIPRELESIVLKALAKNVEDRYQTAMDLHDDLQSFMYTSGNFFARKDLSAYMRRAFAEEIARESARDEQHRATSVAADALVDAPAALSPAPAPPSVEAFEPRVPGQIAKPHDSAVTAPASPSRQMTASQRAVAAVSASALAANVSKVPPSPSGERSKNTMPDPTKGRPGNRSQSIPPPPPVPRVSAPPPPPPPAAAKGAGLDMEWDDDEQATTIYDNSLHDGLLPPLAPSPGGRTPSSPPPGRAPSVSGGRPASIPPTRSAPAPVARPGSIPPGRPGSIPPGRPGSIPPGRPGSIPPGRPGSIPPRAAPSSGHPSPFDESAPGPGPIDGARKPEPTEVTARKKKLNIPVVPILIVGLTAVAAGAVAYLRPKEPGTIQLTTIPPDTTVLFDDQPIRATSSPFTISNVAPDQMHLVEVRRDGFRNWVMQVELHPGQNLDLNEIRLTPEHEAEGTTDGERNALTPEEGQVHVAFGSDPPGAEVVITRGSDRMPLGPTPVETVLDIVGGGWTVEVSQRGYTTWRGPLVVPAGRDAVILNTTLRRAPGQPGAAAATLTTGTPELAAPPPEPTVAPAPEAAPPAEPAPSESAPAAPSGGGTTGSRTTSTRSTATAAAPSSTSSTSTAATSSTGAREGGTGTLRINTRPASEVYVDGRLVGHTPQMNIQLSAGSHRVTLVNEEFDVRRTISVDVRAGETVTKVVELTE